MRLLDEPIDADLAPFSRHLWLRKIPHRVFEEGGRQVLELVRGEDEAAARRDFEAWRSGVLRLAHPDALVEPAQSSLFGLLRRLPVLFGLLGLASLSYVLTAGGQLETGLSPLMTIVDLRRSGDSVIGVLGRLEWWRLVSPILLHFSVPHLLFNCAVVWEVGRRIELVEGPGRLLLLIVLLAVLSNLTQYWLGGSARFGGLSGVAYGLVGFVLLRARLSPAEPLWRLPRGVAASLLVFLVLFSTGITEHLGAFAFAVANGAHWGGLLGGVVLALGFARLFAPRCRPPELRE